jgi:sugar phosphate permease
VRLLIVGLVAAMSVLLYLDRFAISPATDTMLSELKLTKGQFGEAVGAFFLAYALMQIPSGWLSDTFGARWMLALFVVCWSLATMGLGLAQGLAAIWTMRLILGVAQAGAYPAAAGLLKRWVPYSGRGVANSTVAMGGRCGLLLALLLTVPLMLLVSRVLGWATDQWRIVFVGYGLLGLIWAGLFVWLYRDSPREHPLVNQAEAELIAAGSASDAKRDRRSFPWLQMLVSKEVWLMCVINFCVNIGWILLATWLPQYLIEQHGAYLKSAIGNEAVVAATITAIVQLAAMAGGMSGGRATDVFVRAYGRSWGRRLPGVCAGIIVCGLYLLVPQLPGVWWFVAVMIMIAFTIDFGLGATWASYQDIGGRHVASVLGVGNMCGNLGAAYFGRLIGYLADKDQWHYVFWMSAGAMAIVSCCWLLFDASKPIVREDVL